MTDSPSTIRHLNPEVDKSKLNDRSNSTALTHHGSATGLSVDKLLDPDQIKEMAADKRILLFITHTQARKTILFNVFELISCMFIYMVMGYFANRRYLEWSSEGSILPLWDVILVQIPKLNEHNELQWIADWFVYMTLFIPVVYCFFYVYVDLLNHLAFMVCVLILNNMVVENVTVMPSSYGRERCLEFLGLTESNWQTYSFTFSPSGTCAAMMWSGHTVHSILGAYTLLTAMERTYPSMKKRGNEFIKLKTLVIYCWGFIQALLLIFNHGHYTSDIWVGIVIATLTWSHDRIKYIATRSNPFLKDTPIAQIRARVEDTMELKHLNEFLKEEAPELLKKFKLQHSMGPKMLDYVTPAKKGIHDAKQQKSLRKKLGASIPIIAAR